MDFVDNFDYSFLKDSLSRKYATDYENVILRNDHEEGEKVKDDIITRFDQRTCGVILLQ